MTIILEVGTDEQKELIRQEMQPFLRVVEKLDPPANVGDVILAADFDAKVNELQETTDYRSARGGHTTIARVIPIRGSDCVDIVLSPLLFTENHDTETRYFVYVHELIHVVNERKFPGLPQDSYSAREYLRALYTFFDEYAADRVAYRFVDEFVNGLGRERGPHMQAEIENHLHGFAALINDPEWYNRIQTEIDSFRWHHDVQRFIQNIRSDIEEISIALAHLWALVDAYSPLASSADLSTSRFVNDRTLRLHDFLRRKYEQLSMDLTDGLTVVKDYMENFGLRLEDLSAEEYYCHVLDI